MINGALRVVLVLSFLLSRAHAAEEPGRVYRDKVQPHWCADQTKFWYRVSVGRNAYEFILVDAEKGLRQLAFDHASLANALKAAGFGNARAENLPLESLEFDSGGEALLFRTGQRAWSYNLKNASLTEQPHPPNSSFGASSRDEPRSTRRTGEETAMTFINGTAGEVKLFWLDPDGARQSYGTLGAGERRDQHTYAGHVWLVTDTEGRKLGVFEAEEAGGEALINGERPKSREPEKQARARGSARDVSPDGRWRAFTKDHCLFLIKTATQEEMCLGRGGTEQDGYASRVYWSPDSKKLVAMRTRKGDERKLYLVESSPKDQLQPKLQSYEYLKPGDRVAVSRPHMFDVALEHEIPIDDSLFANPWTIGDVRWAPDSSRFTFVYNQRGHQVLRIIAVDAATGKARAIVDEQSHTFIDYSGKLFAEYLDGPNPEIIWMSERDGWNHLYLYDADYRHGEEPDHQGPMGGAQAWTGWTRKNARSGSGPAASAPARTPIMSTIAG